MSSFVSVAAAIIVAPIYLRHLGSEAFGVLGFVLTLQAALLVLDGGIAMSVVRAVAQAVDDSARQQTQQLVHGLARVNWGAAAVVAAAIAILSPALASKWLNPIVLTPAYVAESIAMAGLAIGARWPLGLYQAVLTGSQSQVVLGVINVAMTALTTVGAIAIVALVAPDLRLLIGWLAACAFAHAIWCRHAAVQAIGPGKPPAPGAVPRFYRASAAVGWLGVVGLLLMQADKLVLSRVLPLDSFGHYVIAAMMAGALYAFATPAFHALYPRFSALAAQHDELSLERLYRRSSLALASFVFPVAAVLAFFSESVVMVWTRDAVAAAAAGPIVSLLAWGTAFHGVMFLPYALKLARGASKLALVIAVTLLATSLPAAVAAAVWWGARGAAAAWLVLILVYTVIGSQITHRRLLPSIGSRWLTRDIGPPALLSLVVGYFGARWCGAAAPLISVAIGGALVVGCWIALLASSSRLRLAARGFTLGGAHG